MAEPSSDELELIGVGFGRTGTDSTRTALNRLGFPCYHMFEVVGNPKNRGHLDFWVEVARSEPGTQHDWSRVFANYRATVDNPGACVWRELLEAYPRAKILLTLHPRGAEAWYESTMATIYAPETMWEFKLLRKLVPYFRKMGVMTSGLIWGRFHRGTMGDREAAIARYRAHADEVAATVPAERLLVFRASDGWQPLCDFLGVEIPDEPFPRTNERATMKRRMRAMASVAYVVLALPVVILLLIGWLVAG